MLESYLHTMNHTRFNLTVQWLSTEQGGRKLSPGEIYIGHIEIEDDTVVNGWCFRIGSRSRYFLKWS